MEKKKIKYLPFSASKGAYNIQNNNSTSENSFGSNGVPPQPVIPIVPGLPIQMPGHHPLQQQPPSTQQTTSPQQHHPSILSPQILGSTPLSQIGCPPLPLDQYSSK